MKTQFFIVEFECCLIRGGEGGSLYIVLLHLGNSCLFIEMIGIRECVITMLGFRVSPCCFWGV